MKITFGFIKKIKWGYTIGIVSGLITIGLFLWPYVADLFPKNDIKKNKKPIIINTFVLDIKMSKFFDKVMISKGNGDPNLFLINQKLANNNSSLKNNVLTIRNALGKYLDEISKNESNVITVYANIVNVGGTGIIKSAVLQLETNKDMYPSDYIKFSFKIPSTNIFPNNDVVGDETIVQKKKIIFKLPYEIFVQIRKELIKKNIKEASFKFGLVLRYADGKSERLPPTKNNDIDFKPFSLKPFPKINDIGYLR